MKKGLPSRKGKLWVVPLENSGNQNNGKLFSG